VKSLLLAAGYVNLDVTARLDRVPGFGERVTAEGISRSPGGMTANVACAASRLGMEVRFFGGVGRDDGGEEAVAELQRFGVATSGMTVTGESTTTSLILLGPEGDRAIVSEPLAFDYGPLQAALAEGHEGRKCLHVDGYRLSDGLAVLRRARRLGFVTSADLDGVEPVELSGNLPEIAGTLDTAFLNAGLAQGLAADPETVASELVGQGAAAAVVTLGEEGAVVADDRGAWRVPAPEIEPVDATGAGDAFAAAFLSEWMEDGDAERAGRFAVAAATISVGATGARGRLPDRREVLGLIDAS